ncbi:MAG: hypothetical protein KKC51_07745 [Verrucomicrobia bacterium]|nr:hypothetical protein [Verrucomicrobiota bacterium]
MKKVALLCLLVCLVLPAARAADLPPVMVTVEIRGVDALAEQIGSLASDVGAPLTKEEILQAVGGFMMAPAFEGLATDGTLRLFVLDPQGAQAMGGPPVLLTLPVKGDGQEYLDAVATFFKAGETVEGVEQYDADPAAPAPIPLPSVFVARLEGRLLVGAEQALVRDGAQSIRDGKLADGDLPVSGTFALAVPCRRNAAKLEPLVETISQAASSAQGPMDAGRILQAEFKGLIRLLRQVENVMIGLRANAKTITISSLIEPASGTILQNAIGKLKAPSAKVASLIPANALAAASGFFVLPDEALDAYVEMTDEMYAAMGAPWDTLAPVLREAIESMKGQFVGDYAFGVTPGSGTLPVDFVQVITIRDADQVKAAMEKIVEAVQKMTAAAAEPTAEKAPFSMKLEVGEVRSYQGVEITPYHYVIDLPEEAQAEMPQGILKWFTDMKYELAYVDNQLIYTVGSEKAMDGVIDALKSGEGTPVSQGLASRALLPELPGAATDVSWIRILDIVRTFMKAVPEVPAEIIEGLPATPLALAGYSVVDGGNLVSIIRMSRSDIADLSAYFRSLAEKSAPPQDIQVEEGEIEEIDVEAADEAAGGEPAEAVEVEIVE